jgi:CcmD family protein
LKLNKRVFLAVAAVLSGIGMASAQANSGNSPMINVLYDNGKIYTVVTCLSIIFLGVVVYLFSLERKIKKLEKLQKNK